MSKPARFWIGTLNFKNCTLDDFIDFGVPDFDIPQVRYSICQLEYAVREGTGFNDAGNLHWQMYLELHKPQRLSFMRSLLPGAHWEIRMGSQSDAIAYCSKQETRIDGPFETGVPSKGQGSRSDLSDIKRDLDNNAPEEQIADKYFSQWVRYHKSFEEYRLLKHPPLDKPEYELLDFNTEQLGCLSLPTEDRVFFLYGPSGTGKTSFALAHFRNPLKVNDLDDLLAFRPNIHDGIVFDDLSFIRSPPELAIHLTDFECRQTIRCRYHNISMPARFPRIFVHNDVNALYSRYASPDQLAAITRRVQFVKIEEKLFTE